MITRYPYLMDALIVHEPTTVSVLPDANEQFAFYRSLYDLNESAGPVAAMTAWAEYMGRDDEELIIRPNFRESAELDGPYVFRHEMMQMVSHVPDPKAIRNSGVPLIMAIGKEV